MFKPTRITAFLVVIFIILFTSGKSAQAQERTIKSKYEFGTPELDAAQKLYSGKKYQEALNAFQTIIDKARASSNWEELIYAMEKKALSLRRLNRFEEAIQTMDSAIDLALQNLPKGHFLVSKMFYTRGTTDHTLRDYYNARAYFDTSLVYYANSFQYDSSAYYRMVEYKYFAYRYSEGNSDTLINYLNELKKLEDIRQLKSYQPDKILNILQEYPTIYRQKGDFEQALAYAIQGVQYAKENRKAVSNQYYAEAQFYLAQVFFYKKDYAKALEVSLSAMPIVKRTHREEMPEYYAFNNLVGIAYMALGDHKDALNYLNEAMKTPLNEGSTSNRRENVQLRARIMINLGLCYENLGEVDKAEFYLESSLEEMRRIIPHLSPNLHANYEQLGDFYSRHGNWDKSLNAYDSALRNGLISYSGSMLDFPEVDKNTTYSYTDLRTLTKKAEALREFANSIEQKEEFLLASRKFVQNTHELLIESRQELLDSEGKLFLSKNFKSLYETGIGVCYDLFELTGNNQFFDDALYLVKKSKAILFLEQSQEIDIVSTNLIPIEIKEAFFQSKREIENLQRRFYELIETSFDDDSVMIVNQELLNLKRKNQGIKDSIALILSTNDREGAVSNMLFNDDLIEEIPRGNAVIEFFYGEERIYVFGRSKKSFSFEMVKSKAEVEKSLEVIFNTISTPPVTSEIKNQFELFKKHSSSVYDQLVKPVLADLESDISHLIVVPDEFLSRLPFEILIENDGSSSYGFNDLDYLIKSFNIQYELSSELVNNELPKRKVDRGLLGVGFVQDQMSEVKSGYKSLKGTEQEINFLQSTIEGTYLVGKSGTKSAFLSKAKDYDILHLAIHGKADDLNRNESSLIFNGGGDDVLYTNDLYLASLKARVAVLSACESGIGTVNKGEGTFSIARGFALVGVPSVVMSLWKVNDKTTSDLMQGMYDGFINDDKPINEALRQSKIDYLNKGDEYSSHPYYWAAFLQLGANVELKEENKSNAVWFILVIASLIILIGLRKRKRAN